MVDYNNFAKIFSKTRENMKWEEIDYFLSLFDFSWKKILDIWCWSWRLLSEILDRFDNFSYSWVDLSIEFIQICKYKYPDFSFYEANMMDIPDWLEDNDFIFFIASFHHLQNLDDRIKCLKKVYNNLKKWGRIFMTNWALNSDFHLKKYLDSKIEWTKNNFWGEDYNIKFWNDNRFYHCFSTEELEFIFKEAGFKIIENRLFENDKNFISIIEK